MMNWSAARTNSLASDEWAIGCAGAEQPRTSFRFRSEHVVRREGQDGLPGFRRCHQGDVLAPDEIDAKIAGTPQVALGIVAAAFFHAIKKLGKVLRLRGEGRPLSEKRHAQGGQLGTGRQLVAAILAERRKPLGSGVLTGPSCERNWTEGRSLRRTRSGPSIRR